MNDKEIKGIYYELMGYLEQLPKNDHQGLEDESLWNNINTCISKLARSSSDYSRFSIKLLDGYSGKFTRVGDLRILLGGLIRKIEGDFEIINELESSPSNHIEVNNMNTQNVEIMLNLTVDLVSKINEKLKNSSDSLERNERSFLEKIRSDITRVKDYASLAVFLFSTAKELHLTIDQVLKLLT